MRHVGDAVAIRRASAGSSRRRRDHIAGFVRAHRGRSGNHGNVIGVVHECVLSHEQLPRFAGGGRNVCVDVQAVHVLSDQD